MSVKRADTLKDFLSAAKAKLKLKKKPLSARMHAPPGPRSPTRAASSPWPPSS